MGSTRQEFIDFSCNKMGSEGWSGVRGISGSNVDWSIGDKEGFITRVGSADGAVGGSFIERGLEG